MALSMVLALQSYTPLKNLGFQTLKKGCFAGINSAKPHHFSSQKHLFHHHTPLPDGCKEGISFIRRLAFMTPLLVQNTHILDVVGPGACPRPNESNSFFTNLRNQPP